MIDLNVLLILNFLALLISFLLFYIFIIHSDKEFSSLPIVILCIIMLMFVFGVFLIDVCIYLGNRTG